MNKKGAIEFSMTTIMVVIIGVAVLALGLAWIQGTFRGVGTLTDESIASAETVISELGATGKIGAPASIILKPNDIKKLQVTVRNNRGEAADFSLGTPALIKSNPCFEIDKVSASELNIEPGNSEKYIIAVGATGTGCSDQTSDIIKVPVNIGSDLYGEDLVS